MKKSAKIIATGIFMSLVLFAGCGTVQETVATPTGQPTVTMALKETQTQDAEPTATPEATAEPTATSAPTATPEPTATPTPEPTATPIPTPTEIPHEHSYAESITTEALCEAEGVKTFTCDCGDTYTESIEATGHTYGAYVYNNDATQEKDGTQSRTCNGCGKVETKTAKGTKLPFDPYTLRAVTSLDDIENVATTTDDDMNLFWQIRENIAAGKYEKIRYIASNGKQFCMWNIRVTETSDIFGTSYTWVMAPIEGKYSDGQAHSLVTGKDAASADKKLIAEGMNVSGSINESMLDRDESIPLGYRKIKSETCPVELYKIVETDKMVYVWVEGTNCGQKGVGTCGSFDCTGECLRMQTLNKFDAIPGQKGWINPMWGESGRIDWNGMLLVKFYYMKY